MYTYKQIYIFVVCNPCKCFVCGDFLGYYFTLHGMNYLPCRKGVILENFALVSYYFP